MHGAPLGSGSCRGSNDGLVAPARVLDHYPQINTGGSGVGDATPTFLSVEDDTNLNDPQASWVSFIMRRFYQSQMLYLVVAPSFAYDGQPN